MHVNHDRSCCHIVGNKCNELVIYKNNEINTKLTLIVVMIMLLRPTPSLQRQCATRSSSAARIHGCRTTKAQAAGIIILII